MGLIGYQYSPRLDQAGLMVLVCMVALPLGFPSALAMVPSADQIQTDVARAVQTNRRALDYERWLKSGFTPKDVVRNALDLGAADSLCAALKEIPGAELALFETVIRSAGRKKLPCQKSLLEKLHYYWRAVRIEVAAKGGAPATETVRRIVFQRWPKSGLPAGKKVALTFESGPHPVNTPAILKSLRRAGARATFFATGEKARALQSLVKRTARSGHGVGIVGWGDEGPRYTSLMVALRKIKDNRRAVAYASGRKVSLLRLPPKRGNYLDKLVTKNGLTPVRWNIDSRDWQMTNPKQLAHHVLNQIRRRAGGTVRFHDSLRQTALAIPYLLDQLRTAKYQSVVFAPSDQFQGIRKIGYIRRRR